MKVCYFGIYKPDYSRNKILISGLKQNGIEIVECRTDKKGFGKYLDLARKHWDIRNSYDVMIVGYPGFQSVILSKFLTRKPVVFDAFLSMYDSMVLDRKQVPIKSFRAKYFWWLDKISMGISDLVLIDTNEHKKYISEEFGIDDKKIESIFIGADTDIFYPEDTLSDRKKFKVLFFGSYIPLQGIEYIVKAAKNLEKEKDVEFRLIGKGQEKERILKLANSLKVSNVFFEENIPQENLPKEIRDADVCLGIFGDTEKTKRVIPNKVYECVAMKKPVITADTPAERELFKDGELKFVAVADYKSISDAIMDLKKDRMVLNKIAEKGHEKFLNKVSIKNLGLQLSKIIKERYGK